MDQTATREAAMLNDEAETERERKEFLKLVAENPALKELFCSMGDSGHAIAYAAAVCIKKKELLKIAGFLEAYAAV